MAKLYAEVTSDKNNKIVSKSGNNEMAITIKYKNLLVGQIQCDNETITFVDTKGNCSLLKEVINS